MINKYLLPRYSKKFLIKNLLVKKGFFIACVRNASLVRYNNQQLHYSHIEMLSTAKQQELEQVAGPLIISCRDIIANLDTSFP